ncbi:putative helicase mov-10-B.1 [Poeciliopsis prolifica]|uniref:putative helicase mov-10-B.1 n=1 Tax=Poeciliopsis prolifica TaxID=188132 RepID=UPI002413753A|nr:putative helicase mov-10-B.1 [Poeciliopsis prolifica]
MSKLIHALQSGLLFIEFLGNRLSGHSKDELRNIYNKEFRFRNGVKHPNFSTVLYALRTFNHVDIVRGKIYRIGHSWVRRSSDQPKIMGPHQTHRHAAQKSARESPGRFTTKTDPGVTSKKKQASAQQQIIGPHRTNAQGTQENTTKESPDCSTTKKETGMTPKTRQGSDILQKMKTNRKGMMADKEGIQITSVPKGSDGVVHHTVAFEMQPFVVKFNILNNGENMIYFTNYTVLDRVRCCNLNDTRKVTKANPLPLCPGESYDVVLSYFRNECGYFPATVYFEFQLELPKPVTFCIVREIKAVVQTSLGADLGPVAPYKPYPKFKPKRTVKEVVEGFPPAGSRQPLVTTEKLGDYKCPSYLRELAYQKMDDSKDLSPAARQQLSQVKKLLESALDMKYYSLRFHLLLHLEEIQMEEDIKNYDLYNQTMTKDQGNKKLLVLKVPGVAENRPSVLRGDCLSVRKSGNTISSTVYKGYVHKVELDRVKLGFNKRLLDTFITNMTFDVEFTFNRLTLKLQHRAVDLAVKHNLEEVLFPSETAASNVSVVKLSMLNRRIENNPEQCKAVQHIIAGSSRPAPYIVFGPPGTGKTITMVEAINQVTKADPSAHILACAPSNSACDLLCQRLKPHMSTYELYRMYAGSRDPNSVPKDLLKYCNWDEKQDCFVFPEKEILMKYKIIVTTLFTAGRFVTGGVPVGHFSYVFVDEAGQAEEPQCIIAVAGLLCTERGQLVLAGDPKQLGPIIRSPYAIQHGLGLSLLERMMNRKPYQDLDSHFVTKLLQNYRSHAAILKIPNEEFYNNELTSQEKRETYCNWEALPQKGFPVIFHGVLGKDEREANSPSFFNVSEIETLVMYLNRLEQTQGKKGLPNLSAEDIGIITPYRKQVEKIQKALKSVKTLSHWTDPKELKVGSVEEFQGQEKNIIIISTVRGSLSYVKMDTDFNIGFLSNEKRFNVALTRAKSLLIVIGNPVILRKDPLWKKFINYCVEMKGYVGIDFKNVEEEDLFEAKMKALKITDSEGPVGDMSALQLHVDPGWKSEI